MIQAGEATILVVSDHGGGFNQRGADYLKPWLEEMGLLHFRSSRGLRTRGRALFGKLAGGVYHLLDRNLSRETKLKLVKLLPGLREKAEESITFQGIDWGRTKAYCDGARDEIWINLRGREPEGIVEPGSEYEELQGLIIEQLERTRDLKTGERAVEGVLRRGDIYQGDQWKRAPDLYVHWRTDFVISGLSTDGRASEKMKEVARKPPLNNGGHRMEGILIIRGQPVERSRKIEEAKIIDLAPTVLYLLGVAIPQGMDGRVLLEAFRGEYITTHPLHYREVEKKGESQPSDYSAEEEKTIEERLRGMGYIP
jgi:predicted AlkP superfamily phosphohydrolase/phosphomutase